MSWKGLLFLLSRPVSQSRLCNLVVYHHLIGLMLDDSAFNLICLRLGRETGQKVIGALSILHYEIKAVCIHRPRCCLFQTTLVYGFWWSLITFSIDYVVSFGYSLDHLRWLQ